MRLLKKAAVPLALLAAFAAFAAGCQSVATTSAKLRNQEGNYEMAIDLAKQALASNPDDAEAYFQLGVSYSHLDSVALAYEYFTKASELDPKKARDCSDNIQHNFVKHYKLGQSAYNRNDYETASAEFSTSAQADPTQSVAYYNLSVAERELARENKDNEALRKQHLEASVDAADKVLELSNPSEANYVKALRVAGRSLVELGRADEARERFSRLIEEDPTSFDVIEDIGTDLLEQRNWQGAVVFLEMAAEARQKINAEDFALYYNIGAALYNLRNENPDALSQAIAYYEKALTLQPDEPQTVFNLAVAYVAKEDYTEASHWLEKYTNISPSDAKGWQLLARCYSEMGDKDKARDALARFEALRQ
jgi:tetratricopeptide (TPR) repeat protein